MTVTKASLPFLGPCCPDKNGVKCTCNLPPEVPSLAGRNPSVKIPRMCAIFVPWYKSIGTVDQSSIFCMASSDLTSRADHELVALSLSRPASYSKRPLVSRQIASLRSFLFAPRFQRRRSVCKSGPMSSQPAASLVTSLLCLQSQLRCEPILLMRSRSSWKAARGVACLLMLMAGSKSTVRV